MNGYPGSRIPDPDFLPIPDPKTLTKERGEKKLVVIPFFVATNFPNWKLIYFWNAEEKNLPSFQRIIELFTKKFVTKL